MHVCFIFIFCMSRFHSTAPSHYLNTGCHGEQTEDECSTPGFLTPRRGYGNTPSNMRAAVSTMDLTEDNMPSSSSSIRPAISTMNLARKPNAAGLNDFAVPTPPARKKKYGSKIKAATVAFGRTASFRKRMNKFESAV